MATFKAIAKKETGDTYTIGCIDGLLMIFTDDAAATHVFEQMEEDQKAEMEIINVFVGKTE